MSFLSTRAAGVFVPLAAIAFASCHDDDDDDGGTAPVQSEFSSMLDQAQEVPPPVDGTRVRVSVTNLAPELGTFQTPIWVGFHDGQFDLYDLGQPASTFFPNTNALERLAEDGDVDPLRDAFDMQAFGETDGALLGELGPQSGPIAPGETVSHVFELDASSSDNRYFSYASMVIPSNDAFVANGDPMAHEVFDAAGNFVATDFVVTGDEVLDAGTEVNDESPVNTAFFGQTTPDTGVDENGNVTMHPGFLAPGMGGILDDPMFANADFTAPGYELLSFQFELVGADEPPTGVALVSLSPAEDQVTFSVAASGLSGPVTGAHFHRGAPGVAGPIILGFTDEITLNENGVFLAEATLPTPPGFVSDLRNGDVYVNLHTPLNPAGELRGQIDAGEVFGGEIGTEQEVPAPIQGRAVRVTATNEAPELGTFQTPIWVGFHDGQFDIYDLGEPASLFFPMTMALERLAEDGDVGPMMAAFDEQGFGRVQGALRGILGPMPGPIAPGETVTEVFRIDPDAMDSRYFSYASMIIPSNDAFIANGDPMAHEVFDGVGNFVGTDFGVPGSDALDAGTEVNDEIPANTAFFGQMDADTGVDEGGVVTMHPGLMAPGMGGILDDPMFANADFTMPGYDFLEVRLSDADPGDPATGFIAARLDDGNTEIEFTIQARNLSGPATGMHFHEGAPGSTGPILVDITDSIVVNEDGVLRAQGSEDVTAAFVEALRAGDIYVNIHTALNPPGELRGQVTAGVLDE